MEILYDRNKDYRKSSKDHLPPYNHHNFKSIYEGIELEIQIVDHCNLNCAGCNHFSPCLPPYQMSPSEFEKNLIAITKNIPNVKCLLIVGGEPSLHSGLDIICQLARQYLPDATIRILSNGVNLNQLQQNKDLLKSLDIEVQFTIYPGYTDIEGIKKFAENQNGIHHSLVQNINTRVAFGETLINLKPENGEYNFYNCTHYNLPCLTVKNQRLYFCPFSAYVHQFTNKYHLDIPNEEELNSIDINSIQNNLDIIQKFCFTPKHICNYCNFNHFPAPWHKSYKDLTEFTVPIMDLYHLDYDRYLSIIESKEAYENYCNITTKSFYDILIDSERIAKRFGDGKIDIIIPYYKVKQEYLNDLKNSLLKQTIIDDCIIYLISDNSDNEDIVFNTFIECGLNVVFLKSQSRVGPGEARNIGIKHSYNKYILFFDSDDYFTNDKALEIMYNESEIHRYKIYQFCMMGDQKQNFSFKFNFLIRKNVIIENNLFFFPLFFAEDTSFSTRLSAVTRGGGGPSLSINFAKWRKENNDISISQTEFQECGEISLINECINNILLLYYSLIESFDNQQTLYVLDYIFNSYNKTKYTTLLIDYTFYQLKGLFEEEWYNYIPVNLEFDEEIVKQELRKYHNEYKNNIYLKNIIPVLNQLLQLEGE